MPMDSVKDGDSDKTTLGADLAGRWASSASGRLPSPPAGLYSGGPLPGGDPLNLAFLSHGQRPSGCDAYGRFHGTYSPANKFDMFNR